MRKTVYQGTNITLIFTFPVDLSLIPNFWAIFGNFQNEIDCLSVNSLIDRDTRWLFFMSWSNFRFLLSNWSPIFTIIVMITVLWLIIKTRILFWLTWYNRLAYKKQLYKKLRHSVSERTINTQWTIVLKQQAKSTKAVCYMQDFTVLDEYNKNGVLCCNT